MAPLIQLLKCQSTKIGLFSALITFFVKLDKHNYLQFQHNYLQFPLSKGRVKAISDISTFCGKYLLTSIYPKNVALATKNYCNFPLTPAADIVKKTILQCSCHRFCILSGNWQICQFTHNTYLYWWIKITGSFTFCKTLPFNITRAQGHRLSSSRAQRARL